MSAWTEDDVKKLLSNPLYVGMGPLPALVPEEQWIASACKRIKEDGAEDFLKAMIAALRDSFDAHGNLVPYGYGRR